jgi:ubiquinone/menaquinone biosynthesis C-methylase UbiE
MVKYLRRLFLADRHVCPWWLAYSFDNPLRGLIHPPGKVLGGLIREGQTCLDIGCGMGHFTLAMAGMVGPQGRVFALDIQEQMLARVMRRAEKRGLKERIIPHRGEISTLNRPGSIDFAVAFWMVHEVPDRPAFLKAVRQTLKPGGKFLVAEPLVHTSAAGFDLTLDLARQAGLKISSLPSIRLSRAVLFIGEP